MSKPRKVISLSAQWLKKRLVSSWRRYRQLHFVGKAFVWFLILFHVFLATVLIVVGPAKLAQYLYDLAQVISQNRLGWLYLGIAMVITSYPPLVGYSTSVTLCGFAYGLKGFFLAGPAAMIGGATVFITLRLLFKKRLHSWSSQNEKWQALEAVIHAKGLPLIILIRMSPFPPWVYSNALFSSIEAVHLWQFLIANLFTLPKIFLAVFIGSRVGAFSDGKQRGQMDTQTKVINAVSIAVGLIIGIGTGVIVYRSMQKQILNIETLPRHVDELAAEAIEDLEEAPLLTDYSRESLVKSDDDELPAATNDSSRSRPSRAK